MKTINDAPTSIDPTNPVDLKGAWNELKLRIQGIRPRDVARHLGVSEAQLIATGCGGNVIRLEGDWGDMVTRLESLGEIMALTRNDHAVHERKGVYRNTKIAGSMGLVLDEEIDLRLFFDHWHYGFHVTDESPKGNRRSLQFFDADGTAVHKVYLQESGNAMALDRLVAEFRSSNQEQGQTVEPSTSPQTDAPDDEIDFDGFYNAWRSMEDTHQFFGLLRKFNVGRTQALRNAASDLATRIEPSALRRALELASAERTPIMIFVSSPGVVQIHSGTVDRIVPSGPWINVLDPRFNLHVREQAIDSAWIVRKPTVDGLVTSLELFDASGSLIALLFGSRKPGKSELAEWRSIVKRLENVPA